MSLSYFASEHGTWAAAGLKDYGEFADCVTYCDQMEYGDGQLSGAWYYIDYNNNVIYHGTFGNYNSPGASYYTYAEAFDRETEQEAFALSAELWEERPEYVEQDDIDTVCEPTEFAEDRDDVSVDVLPEDPHATDLGGEG